MTVPFSGGCLCGAVRYECTATPVLTGNCHCHACQKATGAAYMPALLVPKSALKITGEVKTFDVKADSGNTSSRAFCPTCGSRLFGRTTGMPDVVLVSAGSLDDPSWFRPGMNIYTESAQPWVRLEGALPRFPGMPEREGA